MDIGHSVGNGDNPQCHCTASHHCQASSRLLAARCPAAQRTTTWITISFLKWIFFAREANAHIRLMLVYDMWHKYWSVRINTEHTLECSMSMAIAVFACGSFQPFAIEILFAINAASIQYSSPLSFAASSPCFITSLIGPLSGRWHYYFFE